MSGIVSQNSKKRRLNRLTRPLQLKTDNLPFAIAVKQIITTDHYLECANYISILTPQLPPKRNFTSLLGFSEQTYDEKKEKLSY
ncbi:MAG: hypothetical protein CSA20_03465 [Deltaproteobacteria bacterium]|nr:MAG: hypothetical protein CSA20_03465 [Deltaproteobacteria bacterium]